MAALQISNLSRDHLERLRGFASESFCRITLRTSTQVEALWMDEVTQLLQDENTLGLIAENDGALGGFALCSPLPWESRLLGRSMWTIKFLASASESTDSESVAGSLIATLSDRLIARGADFLLCKPSVTETVLTHALEANGFRLMDTLVDFLYDCEKVDRSGNSELPIPPGFVLRLAMPDDVEPLMETARAAFARHFGRFHADPRIGEAAAAWVYEEWIRSCASGWADWVYVLAKGERVAGYSAWKKPSPLDTEHGFRLGHYSIGAVHPDFSGRGFFKLLTRAGMNRLCQEVDWIEGPTHLVNHAVQKAYLHLGWQNAGAHYAFHKWLRN